MKTKRKRLRRVRGALWVPYVRMALPLVGRVRRISVVKDRGVWVYRRVVVFIRRRPFTSFLVVLLLLFFAILANSLTAPKPQEVKKELMVKEVEVYHIGKAARMNLLAQVEKSGVVKIVALTPGVVSNINVFEGQQVGKGTTLITLATNYQGGNAPGLGAALAQAQYKNVKETFDLQKDVIRKQREVAEKSKENADELVSIADKSLSDTRSLIDLNDSLLSTLNTNLFAFEATNSAGVNDQLIFATKQAKSQLQAGNNQLRSALRTTELQAARDKPPAKLADLQKDITVRQLDLQEKALSLSLETSRLQAAIAGVTAAMMTPAAPFAGVVERVHVEPGQSVNPGTPLVTVTGNKQSVTAVARVPYDVTRNISFIESSTLFFGNVSYGAIPEYVSNEATDGQLYTVLFSIPQNYQGHVTDGEYIRIEVPIGYAQTGAAVPFVPIDSVFQTQEQAYVYVLDGDRAKSQQVTLGQVLGSDVAITQGLTSGDAVILNRNVLAGDRVTVKQQ